MSKAKDMATEHRINCEAMLPMTSKIEKDEKSLTCDSIVHRQEGSSMETVISKSVMERDNETCVAGCHNKPSEA